jgi:hypothetical protein
MAWSGLHKTKEYQDFIKTKEGKRIDKIMKNEGRYSEWLKYNLILERRGDQLSAKERDHYLFLADNLEQEINWKLLEKSRKGTGQPFRWNGEKISNAKEKQSQ